MGGYKSDFSYLRASALRACAFSLSRPPALPLSRGLAAAALMLAAAAPAAAQPSAPLATYAGPDRMERIVAAAKKEGSLTLYTTFAAQNLEKLVPDFERRYGVKVNHWRSGTMRVMQRVLAEARANRNEMDVILFGAPEMEGLHREKLLQEVRSPHHEALVDGAVPAHGAWAAVFLNLFAQAYNTDKVKRDELPRNYLDLLHPRWKGRLGVEAADQEWFMAVVKDMGEAKGLKFFRDLVAGNGLSVRTGHSLLTNLVASGEVPLALTVHHYMPEQLKRRGAPIDWFVLEPAVVRPNAVAVVRRAPHPGAALLFYEYLLSDGQKLLADMQLIPAIRQGDALLKTLRVRMVDPVELLDENEKWSKLYEETLRGVR
jgi:iron(III) transport system substrate-binding protein